MSRPGARRGVLLAALLLARPAPALEAQGSARASAGAGVDTNPQRAFDASGATDGVLLGRGELEGQLRPGGPPLLLSGRYDLGAKAFLRARGEDLLAQAARAEAALRPVKPLELGLSLRAKDRLSRAGERDYRDLAASLYGELRALPPALTLELGAERFTYKPDANFSFSGPRASLTGALALDRRHRLRAGLDGAWRAFDGAALDRAGASLGPRRDWAWGAGAGYSYRGPFVAGLDYAFASDRSNAFGQSNQRHRLEGSLAVFLPLRLVLAARGVLQLTRFPDGAAVAPELLLVEDSENTDQLALKLSRAWDFGLETELQAEAFRADFAANGLHYRRGLVQASVGWRF